MAELMGIICTVSVIVKASSGPRYVVGCRSKVDKEKANFRNSSGA
jgi:ATP-dependent 26S proteasome regulatory subunit